MRPGAPRSLRIALDQLACTDHTTDRATDAHRIIGNQIWRTVRALGYREGPVLAAGDGAAPLLGLAGVDHAPGGALVADLDRQHPLGPVTRLPAGGAAVVNAFSVVIWTLPAYDVRLTYAPNIIARAAAQLTASLTALTVTAPGGLAALVATHDLLDNPVTDGRRRIVELADLVGAMRLPAVTYRGTPGTDEVADLLLFRRRATGGRRKGPAFENAPMVLLDGAIVTINTYFDTNIDQVLGTIQHDPTGIPPLNLTVTGDVGRFATVLADRVNHVVETGRDQGLMMTARDRAPATDTVRLDGARNHQAAAHRLYQRTIVDADGPEPARQSTDLAGPAVEQL